jgi:hypothetical protein
VKVKYTGKLTLWCHEYRGKQKISLTERPEHPARVLQTGNNYSTIKSELITENVEISGIHNSYIYFLT